MEWLVGLAVIVGLVGVVVPILPGLLLVAGAIALWAVAEDRWWLLVFVVLITLAAIFLKYAIPARTTRASASTFALVAGACAGIVGMFVVPVVGFLLGFPLGVLVAELLRLRDLRAAGRATVAAIRGLGISIAVELTAGLMLTAAWVVALFA